MMKVRKIALALMLLAGASAAWAGTAVTGTGSSPGEAMDDANRRAAQLSQQRWNWPDCVTYATYERCRQDPNGRFWVCTAFVNNEPGSSCG